MEILLKGKSRGRLSGPFPAPPPTYCPIHDHWVPYVASPLEAFRKKNSNKVRVIHDLSWPPNKSINGSIPDELATIQYSSIDDAIDLCSMYGTPYLAKTDLSDAVSHIFVRESSRIYMA